MHEENGRAWMSTTFKDMTAFDGADGIELGFTALNSYNCSTALRYGGKQTNLFDNGHMEFFGLRLACMNGMTHKVKIDWNNLVVKDRSIAKIGDIVGVELDKVPDVEVARLQASRKHVGDMLAHIQKVEQMFAALPYVVKEMEMSVRQAKRSEISLQEAGKLLTEQGIGPRISKRVLDVFANDKEFNAFGLTNAITAYASHDDRVSMMVMDDLLRVADRVMTNEANPKVR